VSEAIFYSLGLFMAHKNIVKETNFPLKRTKKSFASESEATSGTINIQL
jgi:hypothetical protein